MKPTDTSSVMRIGKQKEMCRLPRTLLAVEENSLRGLWINLKKIGNRWDNKNPIDTFYIMRGGKKEGRDQTPQDTSKQYF